MRKSGGAVIPMQISFNPEVLKKTEFLVGTEQALTSMQSCPALHPFSEKIIGFLDAVSKEVMRNKAARDYSDVITFAFWIRKASSLKLKERFVNKDDSILLGRGVAFHIAPSNVPVNFAYSLVAGLLTGNANIVRVPRKEYQQVRIITDAFNCALKEHSEMIPYIICIRYGREKEVNDLLSSMCDVRIIWGGDHTIRELRQSPLPPRSVEITFADRYSLAVIHAETYLAMGNKEKIAEDFYNDTFFSDQNACTSPRVVVWTGEKKEEAKKLFWKKQHELVKKKYSFRSIQAVNKLTSAYMAATEIPGLKVAEHDDNLILRIAVPELSEKLMDYRDNSGYFYEYDCSNIMELMPICNDKRCQTVAYLGEKNELIPLIKAGVKGIDRIVPMGKTMDFDLIWDGYQLASQLTRTVSVS